MYGMRRRAFLGTVGGTTAVALSGCLEGGMDFEIAELSSPTPVVEDVGSEEDSTLRWSKTRDARG